ncbi:lipopolysaccharide/colanic/teichoic acid biosynthesis glycosyltransferase [Sphingomonas kaistensis]|uniref:Lipopolysaccharide/colanic/teichoic acid biosynthesis glycosyltransferase n=1 Tax=Sphingomonas kaistensis TaxID=298708 RepID=A0A7X6BGK9_9SPHN|nr:sugar transferase [Sphingomonas kaistensis]NJC05963.1 lipopolysaccharide/colanic/teichoic acid biosynthesis glycosyltransferase [Sphingomonas kaistensis]
MLAFTPVTHVRRDSWLGRRRVQLLGAMLLAAFLPLAFRLVVTPEALWISSFNAFWANLVAVCLALWLRLSVEPYPGIRSSLVILPTCAAAHAAVLAFFFFTRLPYDRVAFVAGFLLHVAWFYLVYFTVQRRTVLQIGVVPLGEWKSLVALDGVNWIKLDEPRIDLASRCNAIVADFSADLSPKWEAFLADAALAGMIVYQVKPLSESLTGRVEIDHLSENSFGSLVPARGYFHLKTVIDFAAVLVALPVLLPIMLVAAVAIAVDDGGPVFFRQRRIGHRGAPFHVLKFRTMRVESKGGPVDARQAAMTGDLDPRITRVGNFLRKSRIDELPQVFNILMAEMSWIGPRPEAEVLSHWYVGEIPFYRYRHVVKPGISGWAQTNQGHVAEVEDIHRKLQYDFYYIKYFSPFLDLLILFKTLKTMATGFGAR